MEAKSAHDSDNRNTRIPGQRIDSQGREREEKALLLLFLLELVQVTSESI